MAAFNFPRACGLNSQASFTDHYQGYLPDDEAFLIKSGG